MKARHHCFSLSILTLSLIYAGIVTPAFATVTTDVGTVNISGEGDDLGTGLLVEDDGAKARSTVTKAAIDKKRPTSNPFQLLNMEPGVNASSYDATGLFGGNLRVRGFNSDQMGFTINGAPVNDSGNFAVYPQEYSDSENLCELFVTQGSVDTDAPHVGASGGNVGLVSCGPNDAFGGKLSQSFGALNFTKSFGRLDTGWIGTAKPYKVFVSYSKAKVDKFKGFGGADRDHVDAGLEWKFSRDTTLSASLLFNHAINNNIMALTKAQWTANPNQDYSNVVPQHLAAGNETANFATTYYGYSLNPFKNYLFTSRLQSRINENLTLSAEPYFWYGYGTGGTEQATLAESSGGTRLGNGVADINGNGLTTDTVGVYRGSVTETNRPGITLKANYDIGNNKILAGYWYERARHRQTQPATRVYNNGGIADLWLQSALLTLNNGATYQGRDWLTISTGQSAFVIDTISMNGDRLQLMPGIRYTSIKRDFTNYPSYGTNMGAFYQVTRTYSKLLPSLGASYRLSDPWQVYGNITQNMRAPSNFVLSGWATAVTFVNGAPSTFTLTPNDSVKEETSLNYETGLRYSGQDLTGAIALYRVDFKNRIAQGYNPNTATYTDYNVGDSRLWGFELQAGSKPIKGWSIFGSATYTDSKIGSNFQTLQGATQVALPTTGKVFPDTPKWMFATSVQYSSGPYLAALSGKYVGKRYTTLMNDEYIDGYTTFDLDAGYEFKSTWLLKKPTIRLNISNLFGANYLLANSGSGSSITATTNTAYRGGGTPSYYVGAPRFTSITFTTEF